MLQNILPEEGINCLLQLKRILNTHSICPTQCEDIIKALCDGQKGLPELGIHWEIQESDDLKSKDKHPNLVFDEEIINIIKNRNKGCENKSNKRTPSDWLDECAIFFEILKKFHFKTPLGDKITNKYFCKQIGIKESRIGGRFGRRNLKNAQRLWYELERSIQFRLT